MLNIIHFPTLVLSRSGKGIKDVIVSFSQLNYSALPVLNYSFVL